MYETICMKLVILKNHDMVSGFLLFCLSSARLGGYFFGSWVSFIIYISKMLKIKVCIDLCRINVAMSEQFLDGSQILAGFQ